MCSQKVASLNAPFEEEFCLTSECLYHSWTFLCAHVKVFIFLLPLKCESELMHSSVYCWLNLHKAMLFNVLEVQLSPNALET